MPVRVRKAKTPRRFAFEIELDHDRRFTPDDPAVMPGLDRDGLRSRKLLSAPIVVFDLDASVGEKSDVGMLAEFGSNDIFHVRRPSESRRIDQTLHSAGAGRNNVDFDTSDFAMLRSGDG